MKLADALTKKEFHTLYEALGLELAQDKVISFVGAGGKTTLIYALAKELESMGFAVVVTTTTHMAKPKGKGSGCWREGNIITVGEECGDGKIRFPSNRTLKELLDKADFVLVEADGSKRKPLKVPAEHEPVIPKESSLVVGVLGLNSVGKTIAEVSHRPKDVGAFLKKEESETVTVEDLERISKSNLGLLKGIKTPYRIIWNRWRQEKIETILPVLLCKEQNLC